MIKLIVHMGLHRTATTTLQSRLRDLRSSLESTALVLHEDMTANPALDLRRWHTPGAIAVLRQQLFSPVSAFVKAAEAYGVNRVIVSEENLIGTMPGAGGKGFYPHFDRFARRLARLEGQLKVMPRLVVRRQDAFLESVYAFRVARGLTDDFPTFLARFKVADFDWNRLAESLERFADRTQIAVLEEWQETGRVAENALAFIGIYHTDAAPGRGNRRLSEESTRLMLALNRASAMPDLETRKVKLYPALAAYEKAGDDMLGVLEELALPTAIRQQVQEFYTAAPAVAFTATERRALTDALAAANRQFISRPEVLAGPEVWQL